MHKENLLKGIKSSKPYQGENKVFSNHIINPIIRINLHFIQFFAYKSIYYDCERNDFIK